jgi:4-amino-4-deoxy-L-arabinose transferase-like glycosyltransferase
VGQESGTEAARMATLTPLRAVARAAIPLSTIRYYVWPPVLLLALCGWLFFYGLGRGELYRTESLRALVAAECLRTGDWVVPTLYGEPLLTKPPGLYVAIALASGPAGAVNEVTARLPSAVAATLTVFLFYWYFGRVLGRRAGLVAAAVLPASVTWLERVPTAELDLVQLAWVTAAVLLFLRGLEVSEAGGRPGWAEWPWWQAALLCVAGGVLTKWTAPAFFYLTAVPLLWWRGRLRLLVGRAHLVSVCVAAVPCLAWVALVVARVGWPVLFDTVSQEALQRLSPMHHPRPYPWLEVLTFPVLFLLTTLPWSGVALASWRPGFGRLWDERGRRLWQALHCWAWVNLLFWSVVPGHRPRHALPLQPALAGLAALVWIAWLRGRLRWPLARVSAGQTLAALLGLWLVVKAVHVHAVVPSRDPPRQARAKGRQVAAAVPEGATLYLCRLKDEGILFYYGRPARRVPDVAQVPSSKEPVRGLLTEREWQQWPASRPARVLLRLRDEQGEPIVLVEWASR